MPRPVTSSPHVSFNPSPILQPRTAETTENAVARPYNALIILNRSIQPMSVFERLWKNSNCKVCADGAANWLYDDLGPDHRDDAIYEPDYIVGDFDSLRSDVKEFYKTKGVQLFHDPDQYSTDLAKALKTAGRNFLEHCEGKTSTPILDVVFLGSLAGRVDQGIGVLHELYRESRRETGDIERRIWLVTENSISWVLRPGVNVISGLQSSSTSSQQPLFTENVGILPVYGPCQITTQGFEWDVKNWETEMGGNVSTSNHVKAEHVVVETNHWILFTVEIDVKNVV